ncbi:MAG TPA: serine--tRNA ligase [Alphaproteobacteria bacterium]|nr:serine--tRNA ligase [Alphaproteobacteria bacterium]
MLDIRWIRENPEAFDKALNKRGLAPAAQEVIALDEARRLAIQAVQDKQNRRNLIAKEIGEIKRQGGNADDLMREASVSRETLAQEEEALKILEENLRDTLALLPNVPAHDVPVGSSEKDNVEVHLWGEKPILSFQPKQHFEIGEAMGLMNFEEAAKLSGSRFVVLKGELARLERALASFMLDVHTHEYGYLEVSPPYLVRPQAMYGAGQLPKFADDAFVTTNDYWLIPTAEVPLTNLVAEELLDLHQLPKRYVAYTPCFRSEAGSAGKDTRGMIRVHQFQKVELVSVTLPEESEAEHQRMLVAAQSILERLKIHYRTVVLCTGDMSTNSQKTYDIEVWLPGQNTYREISSCSNFGDYQARRMNTRFRDEEKKSRFVHTLNGSGLAVGRTLVAVLENYQQEDGSVMIPDVLRPYMGGESRIKVQKVKV